MIDQDLGVPLKHDGNRSKKGKVTGFFFVCTYVHEFVCVQVHAHECRIQRTALCAFP